MLEMFPKVASKPMSMLCNDLYFHAKSCVCHRRLCQLAQWVVQDQWLSPLGGWSALLCHFRYWQLISVLPELKSPISYSVEGFHAASYSLAEC